MSAVRNFTQETQQGDPSGATFFNPVDLGPDNIDGWLTGETVYGEPLAGEPMDNLAKREEALYRILAINLYAWRARDNGAIQRGSSSQPLNGLTPEQSREAVSRAIKNVPNLTRMIIESVARAIHETAPERFQDASYELARELEQSRRNYETGNPGYEHRRQKDRAKYGRIVAATLGIKLLGDSNS